MSDSIWAAIQSSSSQLLQPPPQTATPWRRGTSSSNRGILPTRGTGRGRGTSSSSSISSFPGLKQAKTNLGGKQPHKLDLLLSPSRGLSDDNSHQDLRNHDVQSLFWNHVLGKVAKWEDKFGKGKGKEKDEERKREEELGIVLLDLRKLREGLTSSHRVDSFTAEVYELSVTLSLESQTPTTYLQTCLPTLVTQIHPFIPQTSTPTSEATLVESLSTLTLSPTTLQQKRIQFFTLNLLLQLLSSLPPSLSFYKPSLHNSRQLLSSSSPTLHFTSQVYLSLLHRNPFPISSLLSSTNPELNLHKKLLEYHLTGLREWFFRPFEKSYKVFSGGGDGFWKRVLMFGEEGEAEKWIEEWRKRTLLV